MAADETLPIRFQSQIWPGLRTQVLAISIFYHITGYKNQQTYILCA